MTTETVKSGGWSLAGSHAVVSLYTLAFFETIPGGVSLRLPVCCFVLVGPLIATAAVLFFYRLQRTPVAWLGQGEPSWECLRLLRKQGLANPLWS